MEVQKIYHTRQKSQILEMLKSNKDKHMTVDEMLFLLQAQKVSVSRATLYRYLDVLVSTGMVRKYIVGEGDKSCFQYIGDEKNCNNHFHLMCVECNRLIHMNCEKVNDIIDHVESEHHFRVDPSKVVLYGICEDCLRKLEGSERNA